MYQFNVRIVFTWKQHEIYYVEKAQIFDFYMMHAARLKYLSEAHNNKNIKIS